MKQLKDPSWFASTRRMSSSWILSCKERMFSYPSILVLNWFQNLNQSREYPQSYIQLTSAGLAYFLVLFCFSCTPSSSPSTFFLDPCLAQNFFKISLPELIPLLYFFTICQPLNCFPWTLYEYIDKKCSSKRILSPSFKH